MPPTLEARLRKALTNPTQYGLVSVTSLAPGVPTPSGVRAFQRDLAPGVEVRIMHVAQQADPVAAFKISYGRRIPWNGEVSIVTFTGRRDQATQSITVEAQVEAMFNNTAQKEIVVGGVDFRENGTVENGIARGLRKGHAMRKNEALSLLQRLLGIQPPPAILDASLSIGKLLDILKQPQSQPPEMKDILVFVAGQPTP